MEMAIIGLGKMGKGIALKAMEEGIRVVGLTRSEVSDELVKAGMIVAHSLKELLEKTASPRKIFLYIPAGPSVEEYVGQFYDLLDAGDIVVDGGNSYWGDSIRRHVLLLKNGVSWVDLGTSGGLSGARNGACFMAGGERSAYDQIEPILEKIAGPDSFAYVGPSGCGHLVKLIHNGIEFGMLQAIGEGMALIEKFREKFPIDMEALFKVYGHGSVIRSWLIDLMAEQYRDLKGMKVPPYIEDTGEVNWLLEDAIHLEVPIPVISQSVMELFRSRDKTRNDFRSVAMMRHGFGGHPFGEEDMLKKERIESRINPNFLFKASSVSRG